MSDVKSFHLRLTMPELFFLFFRKKKCLNCSSQMTQHKGHTIKLRGELGERDSFSSDGSSFMVADPDVKTKVYYYYFTCPSCNSKFNLTELMNKK